MLRIATCLTLPEPDPDEELLLKGLRARGLEPVMAAWDDPGVDWHSGLTVIRSTWNYHHRVEAFVTWAESVAGKGQLLNPAATVRWNAHKRYLTELEEMGFPVVPTAYATRGSAVRLEELAGPRGWTDIVIKPAVSAGSFGTRRVRAGDPEGELHLARVLETRDAMVQPYVSSVDGYGERSLVWIDGQVSHAIRKSPRFLGDDESVTSQPIADDERATATAIMDRIGAGLLYGRVDLARDTQGAPMVMELELIEPSLFLLQHPAGLTRLVDAIARHA
jgi:glutathione synthase/RimK-type ligase-like ATP-grasp enzyme